MHNQKHSVNDISITLTAKDEFNFWKCDLDVTPGLGVCKSRPQEGSGVYLTYFSCALHKSRKRDCWVANEPHPLAASGWNCGESKLPVLCALWRLQNEDICVKRIQKTDLNSGPILEIVLDKDCKRQTSERLKDEVPWPIPVHRQEEISGLWFWLLQETCSKQGPGFLVQAKTCTYTHCLKCAK